MKPRIGNQKAAALTLLEVLVVIVAVVVFAAMLLPDHSIAKRKSARIDCVNNLKQVGLSFRIWAGDNDDKYPMNVSVTHGGTLELAAGTNAWLNFLVMSNELSTPKILVCPQDMNSDYTTNFSSGFNRRNVSYFAGVDAKEGDPLSILSGDDNFEIGGVPVKSGLLNLASNTPLAWSAARHHFAGNILFAEGSVQPFSNAGLTYLLRQTGLATNRLAIP